MESPEIKNLFRDSDNNPLFPFYWTKNPRRKISVSYDALDESEQGIADYLRTLPVISGHDLIEASKSGTLNQFFTTMGKGKVDTNPLKLKDYLAQSAAAAKKRAADNEQKKKNEDASGSDTVRDPKRQRTSGAAGGKPSHQSAGEASKRQPAEKKKGHDAVPPPHQDSSLLINRPPTPFSQAGTSSAIGGEAPPPLLSLNDPHFNGLDFMTRTFDNRVHKDISGQGPPNIASLAIFHALSAAITVMNGPVRERSDFSQESSREEGSRL
ncbi:uncharacterized protein LOC130725314 [Lotus japonicus]|uniref:uncharacterized protein LOC130725314 n=1 Tax=Lotus japonicus TaxID=34305 RepID=UPI00258F442E|nr:uncharacterized protein LOC130725314 [Lotus japonicus]